MCSAVFGTKDAGQMAHPEIGVDSKDLVLLYVISQVADFTLSLLLS